MPNNDDHLRSDEVQEILSRVPHWMIRWGSLIILLIIILILFLSWLIKYPDIVTAEITISTMNPPQKLIARTSGKLERILVTNQQSVKKGQPLAIVENTASYEDVFKLKSIIDTIGFVQKQPHFPFNDLRYLRLGDIYQYYSLFEKSFTAYRLYKELRPYKVTGNAQGYEAKELKIRLSLLQDQKIIAEKELAIKSDELQRYKTMYNKGVIATQEWDLKNLDYLRYERELRNLNSTISQTRSALNDLSKDSKTTQIDKTKDEVEQLNNAIQALNQLKKAIKDWELDYVLKSSIEGKITFLQIWKENQTITAGDNVFAVIPANNSNYIGKVTAHAQRSGKIRIGQDVNIRLANYPDREFGILKGKVEYISLTPDKNGNLLIDVTLKEGLHTTYNKKISFQHEMVGNADIITDDLRLAERLLYQFRDIFTRQNSDEINNN